MVIADDQLDPAEARFLEGGQEGSPVELRLAECRADTEDAALSIQTDAGADGTAQPMTWPQISEISVR